MVADELRRISGDRTPQLVIERRDAETLSVYGFDMLDAETLLKFAQDHQLYGAVQLGGNALAHASAFDVILGRRPITIEYPEEYLPDNTPRANINDRIQKEFEQEPRVQQVIEQVKQVPLENIELVTFPRVQHVQLFPLVALDFSSLEDLLQQDFVKSVRLGGVKACVEVIVRRRAPKRAQRRKMGTPYVLKRKQGRGEKMHRRSHSHSLRKSVHADDAFAAVTTRKVAPIVSWDVQQPEEETAQEETKEE
mgnify:FL=1